MHAYFFRFLVFDLCFNTLEYGEPKNEENADDNCDFNRPASEGKFCRFKVETLENCSPGKTNRQFGFPEKKPCVFLKLNKVNSIWQHSAHFFYAIRLENV